VTVKRLLLDEQLDVPAWQMIDIFAYNHPIWDNDEYHLRSGELEPLEHDTGEALADRYTRCHTVRATPDGGIQGRARRGRGQARTFNRPLVFRPLYSIMMAELFNHIVLQAPTRRCANTRCSQLFVHQQGRATKGTSRSRGVLYCSASCARAVAQRAYRQRKHRAT
jgi:hypothetical protein